MIKVLRIVNRFNVGGPVYNVTYLTAYLPKEFETKLCGGSHETNEGNALFIPQNIGINPLIISNLQRSVNPFKDREALKEIREIIREFKPDIVHTHASKAGVLGRTAAFKEKVPVVVHTFHGHVFHSYFGKLKTTFFKLVERRLAKKTDAIIAISERQKNELLIDHRIAASEKFHVIPLGFDLDKFKTNKIEKRNAFRSKFGVLENEIAIGIIGRLTAIKNHELFFSSIEKILESSNSKIKAFIIGDGERMDVLKLAASKIEEKYNRKIFVFTSWIHDMDQALPGLDIVALTSYNEGTPVSLIEAQAAGVPVLTTNVGGVEDIVKDNITGFIVNDFTTESFAKKMTELVENTELRAKMSQNGWKSVEQMFHYRRLCADMEKLYRNLLEKKGVK